MRRPEVDVTSAVVVWAVVQEVSAVFPDTQLIKQELVAGMQRRSLFVAPHVATRQRWTPRVEWSLTRASGRRSKSVSTAIGTLLTTRGLW